MNKRTFLFAIPFALGAALITATPASAAGYNSHNNGNNIGAEIRQLDRQIGNIRGLSNREEARLERQVYSLQTLQKRYSRNGYSRVELRQLNNKLSAIKANIRTQARDGDRRRR